VEEFMLLANISAATAVASAFPDRALLRRHPQPNPRKLAAAASAAKEAGARFSLYVIVRSCT
jgi:DIS3-like exonuclease 2